MQLCSLQRTAAAALLVALSSLSGAAEILVSNFFGDNVARYNLSNGAFLGAMTHPLLDGTLGTRVGPDGLLYVCSESASSVLRFNVTTGAYVDTYVGGVNSPTGITFDASGNALIANFDTDSVSKYTPGGASAGYLVSPGAGGLNGPDVGTVIGPGNVLYVPSFNTHSVIKYDATSGANLGYFVTPGFGGLTQPRTILFRNNKVWVASDSGNKVLRYNMDGSFVDEFVTSGSGGLSGASGMAFGEDGFLYVSSWRNNLVLKYSELDGSYQGIFASGLNGPTYLTVVPEPASMLGLAAGVAILLRRRRNRTG
jgi:hypothetical protein